jgi:hypothetical protein
LLQDNVIYHKNCITSSSSIFNSIYQIQFFKYSIIINSCDILRYLEAKIKRKKPFSLLRGGDATLGVLAVLNCSDLIGRGLWAPRERSGFKEYGITRVRRLTNLVGIPQNKIKEVFDETIEHMKRANYIDGFLEGRYKREHFKSFSDWEVVKHWAKIYKRCGIDVKNKDFCDPRFNYFVALDGQYNIFEFLEGKSLFCVCNHKIPKLREITRKVDYYNIPENVIRGTNKLWSVYSEISKTVIKNANRYDVFLVGAGFLGRNIAGRIRNAGGRVLDVGSLFDYWSGRKKNIPFKGTNWLLRYNQKTMLFERKDRKIYEL